MEHILRVKEPALLTRNGRCPSAEEGHMVAEMLHSNTSPKWCWFSKGPCSAAHKAALRELTNTMSSTYQCMNWLIEECERPIGVNRERGHLVPGRSARAPPASCHQQLQARRPSITDPQSLVTRRVRPTRACATGRCHANDGPPHLICDCASPREVQWLWIVSGE